ncbi:MAG: DUF7743 domain-containing protein [Candidatus Hodarchaeales archaeon]|jgi:hypothetical protein
MRLKGTILYKNRKHLSLLLIFLFNIIFLSSNPVTAAAPIVVNSVTASVPNSSYYTGLTVPVSSSTSVTWTQDPICSSEGSNSMEVRGTLYYKGASAGSYSSTSLGTLNGRLNTNSYTFSTKNIGPFSPSDGSSVSYYVVVRAVIIIVGVGDCRSFTGQSTTNSFSLIADSTAPQITGVTRTPGSPTSSDSVVITAAISDSQSGVSSTSIMWFTEDPRSPLTFSRVSGDKYNGNYRGTIPSQPSGTTVTYQIHARDISGNNAYSGYTSYTVDNRCSTCPNYSFESGTSPSTTDWWSISRLKSVLSPVTDADYSPHFVQSPTHEGGWSATVMGPWSSDATVKVSSPTLSFPLSDEPIVDFWMGIGGTKSRWGYTSWTGMRIVVSDGSTTKAIVWASHLGVSILQDTKYTSSLYTEGIETYFYKPVITNLDTLYQQKIPVSTVLEQKFGLSYSNFNIIKIELIGQGDSGFGQSGYMIVDDIKIHNTPELSNTGFETGTSNTNTAFWTETRLPSGSYGPSGDDNSSPWFNGDTKNSGTWAATVMGGYPTPGPTKISSPNINVPLALNPVIDLWMGAGGTKSQWGYDSWTGVRILVSDGTITKAVVWLTHKGLNIPTDGLYTHATFTEGLETYFFKPTLPVTNSITNYQIYLRDIVDQKFAVTTLNYKIVKVELIGQGESGFIQHGWGIFDDVNLLFGVNIEDKDPPIINNFDTDPTDGSVGDNSPFKIWANIFDNEGLDSNNQIASYYYQSSWTNVSLIFNAVNNRWETSDIGPLNAGSIGYKIYSQDLSGLTTVSSEKMLNIFTTDSEPPVILNLNTNPSEGSIDETSYVEIRADITDNYALDPANQVASYYYQLSWTNVSMSFTGSGDRWKTGSIGPFDKGLTITYKVFSVDVNGLSAVTSNKTFYVKDSDTIAPSISEPNVDPDLPDDSIPFIVSSEIIDGSSILIALIHYSIDGSVFTSVDLDNTGNDIYFKSFGPYIEGTNFKYWIEATDNSLNQNTRVKDNNGDYYNLTIGDSDIFAPVISNVGDNSPSELTSAYVSATVTDTATGDSGILWVSTHWRKNGGNWVSYSRTSPNDGPDGFKFRLPEEAYTYFSPGDEIEYYFRASDNSANHNIAQDDNGGLFYSFIVTDSDLTGPSISNVIFTPTNPNGSDLITISTNISDSSGIYLARVEYKLNGGSTVYLTMNQTGGTGYEAILGAFNEGDSLEWRIYSRDDSLNRNTRATSWVLRNIGSSDVTVPDIISFYHSPSSTIDDNETFIVYANVEDASGIAYVTLVYQINGGEWNSLNMTYQYSDRYESQDMGPYIGGDNFVYKVYAVDNSVNYNSIFSSERSITIISSDTTPPDINSVSYPLDPTELSDFLVQARVFDSNGIENVTLTYRVDSSNFDLVEMILYHDYGTYQEYRYNLGKFAPGTRLEFFVVAMDQSLNHNTRRYPTSSNIVKVIEDSDINPPLFQEPNFPLVPTEQTNITINVNVTDAKEIFSVILFYSSDNISFNPLSMLQQSADIYYYNLGYFNSGEEFWFYIEATDNSLNHNVGKIDNAGQNYHVFVEDSDFDAPIISSVVHSPIDPAYNDSILISALVTDDYRGLENVTLYYEVDNSGNWIQVLMVNSSDIYQYNFGFFSAGTEINYYIEAFDQSLNQNKAVDDKDGNNFSIHVSDPFNPEISHLEDIFYELGTIDIGLNWSIHDENPLNYEIFEDGVSTLAGPWTSEQFLYVSADKNLPGDYNYTVVLFDAYGNMNKIEVWVHVRDTTTPSINPIDDLTYELGNQGNNLSWLLTDLDPLNYFVYLDTTILDSGSWVTSTTIFIDVGGHSVGQYNYSIFIFDKSGNMNSDQVWVQVVDSTSPTISHPVDQTIEFGILGNNLSWIVEDLDPGNYTLFVNDISVGESNWIPGEIMINIDNLAVNTYNYTLLINDASGNTVSDTVMINVEDTTLPLISSPNDIIYEQGSSNNEINWNVQDNLPDIYFIFQNGIEIESGSWVSPSEIITNIDFLESGIYNYLLTIYDTSGNSASDEVLVEIVDNTPPNVTNPGIYTFLEGTTSNYIIWVGSDYNPTIYKIYIDDVEQENGTWQSDIEIVINVDDLSVGSHTATIVLFDENGNSVVDTVLIIVTGTTPMSIPTTIPTSDGFELLTLVFSLLVIIIIRFRKNNR